MHWPIPILGFSINSLDKKSSDIHLIDTAQEKEEKSEFEFLSKEWFSQNFILLVCTIITLTIGITAAATYREEILFMKQDGL